MPRGQKRSSDEIRLRVQCTADENHGKILYFKPTDNLAMIEALQALISGTSSLYKFPPGPGSPIGRCAICQAKLECRIERIEPRAPDVGEALRKSLSEEEQNAEPGKSIH